MNEKIVVIDCIRTPMGKAKNGAFRNQRAEDLSAGLMQALVARNKNIDPAAIDDIYWGCAQQTLEQGFNVGRNAALLAGLPKTVPAVTINRLCGSSMEALHQAGKSIISGTGKIFIAGGVEHMGHVPMNHGVDFHVGLSKFAAKGAGAMGFTAEMLAKMHNISREEQDAFAFRSHRNAYLATKDGNFADEIMPTAGHDAQGAFGMITTDEVIRPDTNLSSLAELKPVFDPANGSITAGTASAMADGASAMLLTSAAEAERLGLKPLASVEAMAVTGCNPSIMGIGPVAASKLALARAHVDLQQMDAIELNEAFAAQSLACIKEMGLADSYNKKVNVNGGAIALGHPLGCSGTRISTTLINTLKRNNYRYGLATMCIGLGQGIATVFKNLT